MNNIPLIFNRDKVKNYRNRAADLVNNHDFLLHEVASRMAESLDYMKGGYENILHIGCANDYLMDFLQSKNETRFLVSQDLSINMAKKTKFLSVVADEEKMPFAPQSFDLVLANLVLHNVNDLPGTLIQIRNILKKDGVFMATFYGVDTLKELQQSFLEAEDQISGGTTPRVSPFMEIKTMGSLLQRAGFAQPVADCDTIKVSYDSVFSLMQDLRGMGESNSLIKGGKTLNRNVISKLDSVYKKNFSDEQGGIISTFNVINITGLAALGV